LETGIANLDHAMEQLNKSDRNAILLAIFSGKSLENWNRAQHQRRSGEKAGRRLWGDCGKISAGTVSAVRTLCWEPLSQPTPSIQHPRDRQPNPSRGATAHRCSRSDSNRRSTPHDPWTKINATAAAQRLFFLIGSTVTVSTYRARQLREHARLEGKPSDSRSSQEKKRSSLPASRGPRKGNQQLRQQSLELHRLRNSDLTIQGQNEPSRATPIQRSWKKRPRSFESRGEIARTSVERFVAPEGKR